MCLQITFDIFVKQDLALNNQQQLISHQTKPSFFTFVRLEQGHLKALNHLSFSLLLYFHKSHIFSGFSLPLNPGESGTRPELQATRHLVAAFSQSLLVIQYSEHPCKFPWSHLIQPVAYTLNVDMPAPSMTSMQFTQHFHQSTCILFTLGNRCISFYFWFPGFNFIWACHLWQKGSSSQYPSGKSAMVFIKHNYIGKGFF